jgi:hypothetical protein
MFNVVVLLIGCNSLDAYAALNGGNVAFAAEVYTIPFSFCRIKIYSFVKICPFYEQ